MVQMVRLLQVDFGESVVKAGQPVFLVVQLVKLRICPDKPISIYEQHRFMQCLIALFGKWEQPRVQTDNSLN